MVAHTVLEESLPVPNSQPLAGVDDGRALAQAIVDTIREPLLVLDRDLRVVAASRSFYLTFKMVPRDVQGRPVYTLGDGQWNIPELRLLLEKILPQHALMEDYEVQLDFSGLGRRAMLLNARQVFYEENARTLILLGIEDVTERRAAESSCRRGDRRCWPTPACCGRPCWRPCSWASGCRCGARRGSGSVCSG
jgi:chemotaxis protein methyltransferase CheR